MASKKDLKKYLSQLSNDELIAEVEKLFQKFKNVQDYYNIELSGDTSALLSEYKKRLDKVFAMKGMILNPSMAEANKILKEFEKISIHIADTIDLYLYKAELSIELFKNWGHDFTSVVNSFSSTYDKVVKMIHQNNLEGYFEKRCSIIEDYAADYYLINNFL